MPRLSEPKEYGDRWNAWWWGMQPGWRQPDSPFDMPSEASPASWSDLLCGGPNGILLVILALAWWMKDRIGTNSSLTELEEAAIDVTWVLGQLMVALDAGNKGKKRELEIEPGDDESSSKRYLSSSLNQSKTKTNEV